MQYVDNPNLFVYVRSRPIEAVDPLGETLIMWPPPFVGGRPPSNGDKESGDCGITIKQSPFCVIGKNPGHTWLSWSGGSADCPRNYINQPTKKCQEDYVNNIWAVVVLTTGNMWWENGSSLPCNKASCADITACLVRVERKLDEQQFNLCKPGFDCDPNRPEYHCRHFVDEAMGKCCLKRGALIKVDWLAPIRFCCSDCAKGRDLR
ncbi:MAG: hypothetical protein FLDDKLPJ_02269 [Phycisphaerae bacterium]|nr:hypothetical protein [Phycisphaerae bacterium]